MISWFQAFAFKWVNLYRYTSWRDIMASTQEDPDVIAIGNDKARLDRLE